MIQDAHSCILYSGRNVFSSGHMGAGVVRREQRIVCQIVIAEDDSFESTWTTSQQRGWWCSSFTQNSANEVAQGCNDIWNN